MLSHLDQPHHALSGGITDVDPVIAGIGEGTTAPTAPAVIGTPAPISPINPKLLTALLIGGAVLVTVLVLNARSKKQK